ncbi:hypothetical protein NAP1_11008 [Erythrobacter sp. NAP1]|nr:hypothetical protein NAP1_11008 [Erythrobacter sp. NAP1]
MVPEFVIENPDLRNRNNQFLCSASIPI